MIHYSRGSVAAEVLAMYKDRNVWTEATSKLEFKSGKKGFPTSVWTSYSAFANTKGGYIIIGVQNDGTIEGIDGKAEIYRDEFVNILSSGNKCDYTAGVEGGNIAIVEIENHEVLAIRVRSASVEQKPVFLDGKLHLSYMRNMEGDRKCSPQELSRMIRDRDVVNTRYTVDGDVIPNTGISDLDAETIQLFREEMNSTRANHAWGLLDNESLLTKLGAYRTDRQTGKKGLTLAGLLMFGRTETIMELHPNYRLDFYEFDGSEQFNTEQRWADRLTVDGTWEANLYQFFRLVWPRLTADFKRPFRLVSSMKRVDDSTAHEAVREALANALIHNDYILDGGIQIYKRPDGMTLVNKGTLLMSEKELFAGGNSRCRNKNLQKMFKVAGLVDEAGTGVDKITRGWFEHYLSMPEVSENKDAVTITWSLPYAAMLSKRDMVVQCAYMGSEVYNRLSVLEKVVLLMIPRDGYVSNADLRKFLPRLHAADLGRILGKLRDAGYLDSKGRSSAMRYTLPAPLIAMMKDASNQESSVLNGGKSSVLNGGKSSVLNGAEATAIDDERSGDDISMLEKKFMLSDDLRHDLKTYRKKQRHTRAETDVMVLRLCRGRYLSIAQLSVLMNLGIAALRRDCISSLVRHGKLVHREEKTTHKAQAYTTSKDQENNI